MFVRVLRRYVHDSVLPLRLPRTVLRVFEAPCRLLSRFSLGLLEPFSNGHRGKGEGGEDGDSEDVSAQVQASLKREE